MTKVKELVKCKHPNSRKTNALAKQLKKAKSREKSKQVGNIKLNLVGEKLLWFRDHLEHTDLCYTADQTVKIIEKYLSRFDEELDQIRIKHSVGGRKNRQHASREDIINLTVKRENEEFCSSGLEIPDLMCATQLTLLKEWNGELRFLPKFKLKKYSKSQLEKVVGEQSEKKKCQKETSVQKDILMDAE